MLRSEQCADRHVGIADQPIRRVSERAIDRRGVADEADPAARNERAVEIEQAIDAESDGAGSRRG